MSMIPRELQYKIAKKLDIDTRRILGIYTKLKVPFSIDHIHMFPMPDSAVSATNKLMFVKVSGENMQDYFITRLEYDMEEADQVTKMILYKVASWLSSYEFGDDGNGIIIKAGIPDGSDKFHMSVTTYKPGGQSQIVYGIYMSDFAL